MGRKEAPTWDHGGIPAPSMEAPETIPPVEPATDAWSLRVGRFLLRGLLGGGGMGQVYRAWDEVLQREVALKVMKVEVACSPTARERFLREARAAAALQHDHIVPIFEVGEDAARLPFIARPLLAGESLEQRLQYPPDLSPGEVVRIGREIALGLAAAHAARLIHRDIKPANLWLRHPRVGSRCSTLAWRGQWTTRLA